MRIKDLMEPLRALATDTFQRCTPEQQARAEEIAMEIVKRANAEGFPVVVGTLIAAADMVERVARVSEGGTRESS
jgi:hypothetical protein